VEEPKLNQKVLYWVIGVSGVIALVGLLYLGDRTPSDDASTCDVTGVVTDATGAPIPAFEVVIYSPDKKKPIRRVPIEGRPLGDFAFRTNVGNYTLTCQAKGFAPHEAPFSAVSPGVHLTIVMHK
jgi:hypothetical protein